MTAEKGSQIYKLIERLFPITRSLTGKGVRDTLKIIQEVVPDMITHSIPSGELVFDWSVPDEWNIHDAYIKDSKGNKIVDFKKSNLHVIGYSLPVKKKISLEELKEHISTLPQYPDWIPYEKNYYNPHWGFCMTHNSFLKLKKGDYTVFIDSMLEKGVLNYGEYFKKGKSEDEFLISCYICHPSMANDSLSGVGLTAWLASEIALRDTYYSYRFLFIPETIGSIVWLARNKNQAQRIKFGLIATCLGDPGDFTYKKSRIGSSSIDKTCEYVLRCSGQSYTIEDYYPLGSDERQFCSPGFNLPVGSLMRSRYSKFDQYHTSADDLGFIKDSALEEMYQIYLRVIEIVENNFFYRNLNPFCEPNLGKRGLFRNSRVLADFPKIQEAYFWVLNFSDGSNDLLEIAEKSGLPFHVIVQAVTDLCNDKLLEKE
ncbi:MAG TPA: peptidase M28 [Bacteroidales bacterium]|nr:peptidase M28 [Bacteroidales bacterium]